ncbi:hypothetical protein BY458DRAFT_527012 [Sporodiniella umbellata]|nr:hypothetical protein BY458DRAFT_527012 [Sporodiniella umbellata]
MKDSPTARVEFLPIFLSIWKVNSVRLLRPDMIKPTPRTFRLFISQRKTLEVSPKSTATRTIWYKILHRSIPHTGLLHKFPPTKFQSDLCPLCKKEKDSLIHFLYACPKIVPVWQQTAHTYFDDNWSPCRWFFLSDLHIAVTHLTAFPLRHLKTTSVIQLSSAQIIACTLQAIWSARWRHISHQIPFATSTVFAQTQKFILQLHSELQLCHDI